MKIKLTALALMTVMVCTVLCGCELFEQGTQQPGPQGSTSSVYITEIVSRNESTLADDDGEYSDYIELYNSSSSRVALKGYYLSDNDKKPQKWALPNIYIEAKSYLVIFASGKNRGKNGYYHTNFSLSASKGETVSLVGADGAYASRVELPACPTADISYGLVQQGEDAGKYMWFATPTPGAENSGEYAASVTELRFNTVKLIINEFVTKNKTVKYDADGDYSDFIEIYNPGEEEISLEGMYLSDNLAKPDKWRFPAGCKIGAGEYLLIYASGKDKVSGGEIHTSFSLSANDSGIVLSDSRMHPIDSVTMVPLQADVSYGRDESGQWKYYPKPTPGAANTTPGFEKLNAAYNGVIISGAAAASGGGTDTVTLKNNSDKPVSLAGCGLAASQGGNYVFDELTLQPGQSITLLASGSPKKENGKHHLPFKLRRSGTVLTLSAADGVLLTQFSTGKLRSGVSVSNTEQGRRYSQGEETDCTGYTEPPEVNSSGGYTRAGTQVTVTVPEGTEVYYTTDGSKPDKNSRRLSGSITVTKSMSLRVAALRPGKLMSDVVTRTFLVEEKHDLPVICLSGDPDGYFSTGNGIFSMGVNPGEAPMYRGANFWKNWERESFVEYFTAQGERGTDFNAGIKIHGDYSRIEKQKSIAVYIRDIYGTGSISYPFFENNEVTRFGSFILRMGGQDWSRGKIRDSFISLAAKGTTELAIMDAAPVAVYINGEYFGLYFIREKLNEKYFETHYGIAEENLEVIRANTNARHGSAQGYKELIAYVSSHDLSNREYYDYVCSQVDIDSYIDWWVFETWFVNTDSGNIKFFRDAENGKWKWALFDMDWALFPTTYTHNYLSKVYANGHGVGGAFSTVLIRGLLKNPEFKQHFIERYSYHVNNTLNPDRLFAVMDELCAKIRTEMPRQAAKWGAPKPGNWERNIKRMKEMCLDKIELTKKQMQSVFGLSASEAERLFSPVYSVSVQ